MDPIRVATWNVSWTSTRSKHIEKSRERIAEIDADILVLTETTHTMVPGGGYFAKGGPNWGYGDKPDRRKVLIWSRWPITDVAAEIHEPGGRHVSATAMTPFGPVRVHGVCVPWSMAHVSGGHKNAKPWSEHLAYLAALREILKQGTSDSRTRGLPVIVAGDINQRDQPRPYGNQKVRKAWAAALAEADLSLVTDETVIDKIAISPALDATDPLIFPPEKMSDHHAVSCLIRPR